MILGNNVNLLVTLILLVELPVNHKYSVVTREHMEQKRKEMFINKLKSNKAAIYNLPEFLINVLNVQ